MKHFEELHNSDNSVKNSAEDYDYAIQHNNECKNFTTGSESPEPITNSQKYQNIIESVVNESRLEQHFPDCKSTKKLKPNQENEVSEEILENNTSVQSSKKTETKGKRKLKHRLLEKLLDEEVEGEGVEVKCSKKKNIKPNKKCEQRVEKIEAKRDQQNETIQCKQKKAIVSVRRRRFRSGLDMIRQTHRRKKSRVNQMQGSNKAFKDESNRSACDVKTSEDMVQKSNSESGIASVPTEMKRLMVNKALGETLLHRAARSNRKDVVHSCLQSNTCDVNVKDNANYTPLHECSTRGNLEIARILLQNGADVNASAAGGIRPIHDAIENNHLEVVRLLLSYGADPNISTYSGSTPLHLTRSKAMQKFLRGFLSDISGECQTVHSKEEEEEVLSWKFNGSSLFLDTNQTGFNVFDGLPSDGDEEESHDFLFEVSDTPLDPTYRLPNSRTKGTSNFMLLSDVLRRTGLTKEEFAVKHSLIEIVTIGRDELDRAAMGQLLVKPKVHYCNSEEIVVLEDNLRSVLGIETLRLK